MDKSSLRKLTAIIALAGKKRRRVGEDDDEEPHPIETLFEAYQHLQEETAFFLLKQRRMEGNPVQTARKIEELDIMSKEAWLRYESEWAAMRTNFEKVHMRNPEAKWAKDHTRAVDAQTQVDGHPRNATIWPSW